jgi:ketosteroid isomerase-like protein
MSDHAPQRRRGSATASQRERNVALVGDAVEAFQQRDVAGLLEFLDPAVECHVSGELLNAGTWHGQEGFAEMVAAWEEAWGRISYEAGAFETPDDDHVLAEVRQRAIGAQSGVPVELSVIFMVEFRDARAVRLHIYPDRESALAATARETTESERRP